MTIGCDEAKRWLDAWLDGELDPSAALHVEAHLARCCGCRGEAEGIKQLKRAHSNRSCFLWSCATSAIFFGCFVAVRLYRDSQSII